MQLLDAGSTVLRLNRFLFSNIQVQAAILNQQEIKQKAEQCEKKGKSTEDQCHNYPVIAKEVQMIWK